MEGEAKDSADIVNGLTQGFILAIIAVYALLAIPLKSYTQPLIIMAIIPFSLIGAIAGHLIMDTAFSMMSFFGVIALIGVAVNDSLILTDAVNQQRAEGQSITDAVLASCKRRFRAILLTSLTTLFWLIPDATRNQFTGAGYPAYGYFTGLWHCLCHGDHATANPVFIPDFE